MKKVVKEVSVRRSRGAVKLVGYSQTDRGTKFVNGVVDISTVGKSQAEVVIEIGAGLGRLLKNQSEPVQVRLDLPGSGG